ncbi:MAG: DUF3592 domain-containing protein [Akkermansia sp.]|nr:DUF3592 domain-containing protein [Akkermansia sp.]
MKLIDTDFTLAEREQLEAAMGSDKTILWAGRPVAKAWTLETALTVLSGVAACGFMGFVVYQFFGEDCVADGFFLLVFCCALLPFAVTILWQLLAPWRRLRRLRRTAYLLTPQLALVVEPAWFGKRRLTSYPVQPGMVKEHDVAPDGSGSLVFAYNVLHGKNGSRHIPLGFLDIARVQRVKEILDSLVDTEAQPPAAAAGIAAQNASGGKSVAGVVVGCIFALVGVGALVGSGVTAVDSHRIVSEGIIAQGEVVSLKRERSSGRRSSTVYHPVFRFTAQDGKEYRVKHNQGSNPPAWKKGEKAELIYLPGNPESAVPNTFWGKYAVPFIIAIFGTGFTVLGSVVAWRSRKG